MHYISSVGSDGVGGGISIAGSSRFLISYHKSFLRCILVIAGIFDMLVVFSSADVCPSVCVCKWKSGKQSVECTDKALITIPEGIDPETQLLDMSDNNLQVLPKETFIRAKLYDLQKVYLRNCKIGQIDDSALQGLLNVVDLDLSHNLLTSVPSSIFKDVPNLRNFSLAHNPIHKIEAFAFQKVPSLIKLDLSHCQIKTIAHEAFQNIDFLELLRLNGNMLSALELKTIESLNGLHSIELHDNPWHCDCKLRSLKIWLTEKNIPYSIEPRCVGGPTRIQNRTFSQLHADDFACKPEMKIKSDNRYVESTAGDNATIVCRVESTPKATFNWYWNGRLLLNNSAFSNHQKIIIMENGEKDRKSMLILTNAQESDSSQFYCIAENQAGTAEANFTLRVVHRLAGLAFFTNGNMTSISVALIVLIFSILIVVVYLLFRMRKIPATTTVREHKHSNGGGGLGADDIIPNGIVVHAQPDNLEKSQSIQPVLQQVVVTTKNAYPNISSMYFTSSSLPPSTRTEILPRLNGISSYHTAIFDGCDISQNRGTSSGGCDAHVPPHPPPRNTSNPDLIADTRYQEASGMISQQNKEIHYPSSLWNQNEIRDLFQELSSGNNIAEYSGGIDANDKTPIIEDVSFYDNRNNHRQCTSTKSKDCEFPTTSSPAGSPSSITPSSFSHPNAKTIRVWQKGVQVLPPVTALKRVLNRNSPDEGYQEGCGTDV